MTSGASNVVFLRLTALVLFCLNLAEGGPRYIAIPIDGVDIIELNPVSPSASYVSVPSARLPRQTETFVPVSLSSDQQQSLLEHQLQIQPVQRSERGVASHILDYVDFGSHTGPNGAYGWYADYPSHH